LARRAWLPAALAPFTRRDFRFQWPADLATSWAFEMETLVLGWYVLVATGSVVWLSAFGALQFGGTLISPMFGVWADRAGHRNVLGAMRATYALFAAAVLAMAAGDLLGPVQVLVVAGLAGLVRPSDIGMRNALVAATMPPPMLMSAMALERCSADTARIAGALAGAGLAAALGMAWVYGFVVLLYLASLVLTLRVADVRLAPDPAAPRASPWGDLAAGFHYVRGVPPLVACLLLAFLVNALAYPLCTGMLAFVVRDVYGADQAVLGMLLAGFAAGALAGSVSLSIFGNRLPAGRVMLLATILWFPLLLVLAQVTSVWVGFLAVTVIGFVQSYSMVPMSVVLLRIAEHRFRGRVMGLRMLAIYGLPAGLLVVGALIEWLGFRVAASLFAGFGFALTLAVAVGWLRHLWPEAAAANAGRG
jgi:MFS family permease